MFVGYAFAEGWAHYTEEMMRDAGLRNGDLETHVGQISSALLRDCRYLSAIGMRTGRMTQEQSCRLFPRPMLSGRRQCPAAERPRHLRSSLPQLHDGQAPDPPPARRRDEDAGRPGAWKQFHDRFLSYGGPPLPLVRAQMMGGDAKAVF